MADPLAMPNVVMIADNHYGISALESIFVQSSDTVTVQSMSLTELLMVYQALVLGVGHLQQTPLCWPYIANAIANIYESMAEYFVKRDQPSGRNKNYIDYAERHFDGHISVDICNEDSPTRRSSHRLSLTAALLNRMFSTGTLQTATLDGACFYIKMGNRTVFILRTLAKPTTFYRVELADSEGRPFETARVRSAFMQAVGTGVRSFSDAFGQQIINSIDAIEE
ncbi:hypothetical protein BSLG_000173 [Batrachochytrium salamandrivorans]|nr:hypothetical protein BSLG_000173 [Batrachochytrium salamandrivorans]